MWFNAWQYEREEEPVVPLLLTIQQAVEVNEKTHSAFWDSTLSTVWKALKKMPDVLSDVASGVKLKTKLKTPLLIQLLTGIDASVETEFDAAKMVEGLRETFAPEKDVTLPETTFMRALRELNDLSKGLADASEGKRAADRPKIVVFVDDLDRCHPDAALRLLDGIKLVLSQSGFVFVLALDKTILEEFLVRRYREEYCASNPAEVGRRYVDKIIQLEVPLPPSIGRFEGSDERMRVQPSFKGRATWNELRSKCCLRIVPSR